MSESINSPQINSWQEILDHAKTWPAREQRVFFDAMRYVFEKISAIATGTQSQGLKDEYAAEASHVLTNASAICSRNIQSGQTPAVFHELLCRYLQLRPSLVITSREAWEPIAPGKPAPIEIMGNSIRARVEQLL
ncbi:hypothetical protein AUJ46_01760 [Candidatus Peregrinibacteria bacterium CG1_02_54_53]|nr:MAG: hypothetical protein AUJ46_01760 [Candidatus Peregrinibacteria bacterium CG1_02_54_53]